MSEVIWSPAEWARAEFGGCELGDRRRVERAVKYAEQAVAHPDGSTPEQTESWGDCKAAYRLFDCEDVTFTRLAEPHWQRTRSAAQGVVLLIDDTTETDYGRTSDVVGLGQTGNGGGYGFYLHSSLMVEADSERILGLAGGEIFLRRVRNKKENTRQRTQRPRPQSEVWGRVIEQVGRPAPGVCYIHVCDRGADNLEVFCRLLPLGCGWVIRASHLKRKVRTMSGESCSLNEACAQAKLLGRCSLSLRETDHLPAREATLEIRVTRVWLPRPQHATPWLKRTGLGAVATTVVEVREIAPPPGATPLRWVLFTDQRVENLDDARRIIGYYEQRWLIEEFHKALKTGCRLEARQYQTRSRLEAVTGLLSVVAVRLVQLKTLARTAPQTPADHVVPRVWLDMLRSLRKKPIATVRDFYRHLAGLGGFLMRKNDGEPGWITLWRGLNKLILCLRGHLAHKKCG
jgi:hypothetical protein